MHRLLRLFLKSISFYSSQDSRAVCLHFLLIWMHLWGSNWHPLLKFSPVPTGQNQPTSWKFGIAHEVSFHVLNVFKYQKKTIIFQHMQIIWNSNFTVQKSKLYWRIAMSICLYIVSGSTVLQWWSLKESWKQLLPGSLQAMIWPLV